MTKQSWPKGWAKEGKHTAIDWMQRQNFTDEHNATETTTEREATQPSPTVFLSDPDVTLWHGDVLETLRTFDDGTVDCVVTSPPYWGLRDYGNNGQLGLEATPDLYIENMVGVFREVWRVLADHGTCWVNMGDAYGPGKQLVMMPARLALALQDDGWILRADVVWSKPNPMPESVTDRPTKSHEYVFLLAKRPRYFFDQEAVREPNSDGPFWRTHPQGQRNASRTDKNENRPDKTKPGKWLSDLEPSSGRNIRSVWEIATQPYPEAHFATFPEELARRCILAGCPEGGTVLDPFVGSGTVPHVARKHGRHAIGIDLNGDYLKLAARRLQQLSLLSEVNQ